MTLKENDCSCWGDSTGFMTNSDCILHGINREEDRNSMTDLSDLTFKRFKEMNLKRHVEWPRQGGAGPTEWSLSDWGVAVAEEAGEICGAIKRLNRLRSGHQLQREGSRVLSEYEALHKIKVEIGDLITYLDLMAQEGLNCSLEECIRQAFNGVSERESLPHRI